MSAFPDDRRDLAAMFAPLTRALIAREEPVLHAHDISMWGYIVLTALVEQPVRTQAALAQAINADKSRIISVLDELQERGLIHRQPDEADRRVHLLSLTPAATGCGDPWSPPSATGRNRSSRCCRPPTGTRSCGRLRPCMSTGMRPWEARHTRVRLRR